MKAFIIILSYCSIATLLPRDYGLHSPNYQSVEFGFPDYVAQVRFGNGNINLYQFRVDTFVRNLVVLSAVMCGVILACKAVANQVWKVTSWERWVIYGAPAVFYLFFLFDLDCILDALVNFAHDLSNGNQEPRIRFLLEMLDEMLVR